MWRKLSGWYSVLLALGFLVLARPSYASDITFVSISPDAEDITSQMDDATAPAGVTLYAFNGAPDTMYTIQFSSAESPAMVVMTGADMTTDQNWTYDSSTEIITVYANYTGFAGQVQQQMEDQFGETMYPFFVALVPVTPKGQDGPPEEMIGGWLTTNVSQWRMIPPSSEQVAFGYELSGPQDTRGFLHMYVPDATIDLLSQMSGKTLTIEDLAVFNGDSQSSLAVTAVIGGVLIDVNVLFSNSITNLSSRAVTSDHSTITKTITVQEQLPISLSANRLEVKKGKVVRLYGWVKDGAKKTEITLWKKLDGESDFTLWKRLKLKKNGYYTKAFKAKQTATYEAIYYGQESPEQIVTVN